MKITTNEQIKRANDVSDILNTVHKSYIREEFIDKIRKKFPEVWSLDYVDTSNVEVGYVIRTVDLNLEKVSITGVVVKIDKGTNNVNRTIHLFNKHSETYWKIKPNKYYLFVYSGKISSHTVEKWEKKLLNK